MHLIILFVSLATAFRIQVISDTRLDLVTRHYPQITNLVVCNSTLCVRPLIEDAFTRIIVLKSPRWNNVFVSVDLFSANGTLVDRNETRVEKPVHTSHYWPVVTIVGAASMGVLAYVVLRYFPKPHEDKEYHSQREQDRLLAREMGIIH